MTTHLDPIGRIRRDLARLKKYRNREKFWEKKSRQIQSILVSAMREHGGDSTRFWYTFEGKTYVARVVQNSAPQHFDEDFIPALKREGYWEQVSSEYLDNAKLKAEISNGNIPASFVEKHTVQGKPGTPYVRFDDYKEGDEVQ